MEKYCINCKHLSKTQDHTYDYVCSIMSSHNDDLNEYVIAQDYECYAADLCIKKPKEFYCSLFEGKDND